MGAYLWNAWSGWLEFTDGGKLVVLFLAAVWYLILGRKLRGPQGRLVFYGGIAAVLCIFPVTAAVLMKYQTLFYDYPWIWSYVPLTAVIALGGTVFLTEQCKSWQGIVKNTILALLCVGLLVLCGGLGRGGADTEAAVREQDQVRDVLEMVKESCGEEFCLWAPREILEYTRSLDAGVCLLYGRNMWDAALDAYSYDVYSKETGELYEWMEHLRDYEKETSEAEVRTHVGQAFAMGADCILLPKAEAGYQGDILTLAKEGELEVIELEGYYLLKKG